MKRPTSPFSRRLSHPIPRSWFRASCSNSSAERARQEYYERLQRIRTDGEWEPWMDFFLHGVESVANAATKTIGELDELVSRHRDALGARSGSVFQAAAAQSNLAVFDYLCQHLVVTANRVAASTGISPPTVRRVLREMQGGGMVREASGKARNQVFIYQSFIDLLDDAL